MDEQTQPLSVIVADIAKLKEAVRAIESAVKTEISKQVKVSGDALLDVFSDKEARLAASIAELEKLCHKIQSGLEKVEASDLRQSAEIDENRNKARLLASELDKVSRLVSEHEIRLNGKRSDGEGEKEPSIESLRRIVDTLKGMLDGTRGGVALVTIVDKFREVSTVVNLGKFLGAGTVASLVGVWLNINQPKGPSTDVLMLQEQVKRLTADSESQAKAVQDLRVKLAGVAK